MNLLSLWTRQVIQYTVVVESHNCLFLQWLCEKCLGGSMPLRVQLDVLGALFLCCVYDYQISSTSVGSQEVILSKTTEVDTYIYIAIAKS